VAALVTERDPGRQAVALAFRRLLPLLVLMHVIAYGAIFLVRHMRERIGDVEGESSWACWRPVPMALGSAGLVLIGMLLC
jgi:hypothetical protein